MRLVILESTPENVGSAVALLRKGQCIGLPTETVYGLAGDGLNATALARIFEIKNRPFFDPLILHVPAGYDLLRVTTEITGKAEQLMKKFWPGPLTLLLPKQDCVPDLATSGLKTVALRCPDHPVAQAVLSAFGGPLAAPSANRFGRISPTTVQAVVEELGDSIPLILNGGPCRIGVESTILDATGSQLRLLRPGGISLEEIERCAGPVLVCAAEEKIQAPGMLKSHYAPRTPLFCLSRPWPDGKALPEDTALLRWTDGSGMEDPRVRVLSPRGDLVEAATRLFQYLRELDGIAGKKILVEPVPAEGLGRAINDRLEKASSGRMDI